MLNFTAAILVRIWLQNPKIKMAVSQKLFKVVRDSFPFSILAELYERLTRS